MEKQEKSQKPLTLEVLTDYNQKIFLPAMGEKFVGKKEFDGFKNESLTNQDKILKKLDTLLTEKKVREYKDDREKKLLAIIIQSLEAHKILSPKDLERISQLEIF